MIDSADKAIAALRAFFPGRPFPPESVAAYAAKLAGWEDEEVVNAIARLVDRPSPFIPTTGEIEHEIREERLREAGVPSEQQAWEMVTDPETMGKLPPIVADALKAIGGRTRIRVLEDAGMGQARREFVAAYAHRREHASQKIRPTGLPSPTMESLPVTDKLLPRGGTV